MKILKKFMIYIDLIKLSKILKEESKQILIQITTTTKKFPEPLDIGAKVLVLGKRI